MDHKSSLGAQVAQVAQAMRAPLTPPTDHSDLSDRVDDDLELPTKLQDLSLSSPPSKVKLPNGSAVITNGDGAAQEKMRVFLVQTAHGLAPSSGGFKANYYFLVQLAQDDHNCAQICYAFDSEILLALDRARRRGIDPKVSVETFEVPGAPGPRGDGEEKDELKVTTFINEDRILCITICRQEFILYYDTKTFFTSIKEYLEVSVRSISMPFTNWPLRSNRKGSRPRLESSRVFLPTWRPLSTSSRTASTSSSRPTLRSTMPSR